MKKDMEAARQCGRYDRLMGKARDQNPYTRVLAEEHTMARVYRNLWFQGWDEADANMKEEK